MSSPVLSSLEFNLARARQKDLLKLMRNDLLNQRVEARDVQTWATMNFNHRAPMLAWPSLPANSAAS